MAMQVGFDELAPQRSAWRFFPWIMVGALGLVVTVNVAMAVMAYRSAPGLAVQGSFATSNAYGRIQQEARRQAGLGWSLDVALRQGHVEVVVQSAAGAALPQARVTAQASRPMGDAAPLVLEMRAVAADRFRADLVLPGQGQWDVSFTVSSEGRSFRHVRRVVVE